jgi:peptide deformylase
MRLKIVGVGDPVLRAVGESISRDQLLSSSTQALIDLMRETMRDAPGVGLAAPQIGEPLQLAVIEDRAEYQESLTKQELKERDRREIPFHVIVNPVLELLGDPTEVFVEGCLSLPGFSALVPRSREVRVHCWNHGGEAQVIEASGWYARILQHEIDHLSGMLYIDRMQSRSFSTIENYNRYAKNQQAIRAQGT